MVELLLVLSAFYVDLRACLTQICLEEVCMCLAQPVA